MLARVDTKPFTPAASNPWIWDKSLFLGLIDMCLSWLCQTNKSNFILSPDPGTPDTNGIFKKLWCLEVSASSLASIYQSCPSNSVCLMKQQCPSVGQPTSPCWLEAAANLQLVPTLGLWRKDMVWSFYFMKQSNRTCPTFSSAFLVSGTPRIHQQVTCQTASNANIQLFLYLQLHCHESFWETAQNLDNILNARFIVI